MRFRAAVVRYQLSDGFSDDIFAELSASPNASPVKVIVLVASGTPTLIEARQLGLGADCVQRDPVRADVLMAYVEKYLRASNQTGRSHSATPSRPITFLGAILHPLERTLQNGDRRVLLTPREVALVELLAAAKNQMVAYETLYNEILGRQFRGDTSNMRVLLAKLHGSMAQIGLSLRDSLEVVPKSGYRYHSRPAPQRQPPPTPGNAVVSDASTVRAITEK
jgi:DNA-binding response OmpR family regulator